MFAARPLPALIAICVAGTSISVRSVRSVVVLISEELTMSRPPDLTFGENLSNDGRLNTHAQVGLLMIGEPIRLSDMTTVQYAVPPRISAP